MMLDQEGFECDPISKREGDTPLHTVVRWINEQGEEGWEYGAELVGMMVEAGSDARYVFISKLPMSALASQRRNLCIYNTIIFQ